MNIKGLLSVLAVVLVLCAYPACTTKVDEASPSGGNTEKPVVPELSLSEENINFLSKGGEIFLTVTTGGNVAINYDASWLNVTYYVDQDTDNLKITASRNQSKEDRAVDVILSVIGCDDVVLHVSQKRQMQTTCDILDFGIKAESANLTSDIGFQYDAATNTFSAKYLKWINGESPEMMAPYFRTNGAKVTINGQEIISGVTEVSFADDFKVVCESESGDIKEYNVVFNCPQINREVPVLHFKPESEIKDKNVYVRTMIELYDKTPSTTNEGWWNSETQGAVEMRRRGNSTWGLPKKPFRLKFPIKYSPIGLNHAKDKSWTLLPQDMDKSLLRNHIALEYSRILFDPSEGWHDKSAILFTPASKFINVYITGYYYDSSTGRTTYRDGEYLGLYQMSDQMERGKGRIDVEKIVRVDGADPAKITGGYILETDIHEGNKQSPVKGVKMSYKYPEDDDYDPAQYSYITDFIGQAERVLYSQNFKDPVNGWRKYFDQKTMADFIIVKELAGDADGYTSTYFYKRRGVDKLFFGPIWDCDKGWDNDRRVPTYRHHNDLMMDAGFKMPYYIDYDWFNRVWDDETFRAFVAKRWAEKKDQLLAVAEKTLTEMPQKMHKAIEANFTVWKFYYQFSQEANMPAKTYEAEIQRLRDYTKMRAEVLDRLFNQ